MNTKSSVKEKDKNYYDAVTLWVESELQTYLVLKNRIEFLKKDMAISAAQLSCTRDRIELVKKTLGKIPALFSEKEYKEIIKNTMQEKLFSDVKYEDLFLE